MVGRVPPALCWVACESGNTDSVYSCIAAHAHFVRKQPSTRTIQCIPARDYVQRRNRYQFSAVEADERRIN